MLLRVCTWGLLLLFVGLLAHTLITAPEESVARQASRALALPQKFPLKALATAGEEIAGAGGMVVELLGTEPGAAVDAGGLIGEAADVDIAEATDGELLPAASEADAIFALGLADLLRVIPVDGPISSEFGPRVLISFSRPRMHSGVDIKAARGAAVKAAGRGTVVFAGRNGTYGLMVKIDHGQGLATWYAHMDKALVAAGDVVEPGQQVGTVGKTGKTTGANLHLEVRYHGKCIDPRLVFTWPPSPPRKPKPQLAY